MTNSSVPHSQLEIMRKSIDEIDDAIVRNIADRLAIVKKVGEYKKSHDLDIQDPNREAKLYIKLSQLAVAHNVPLDLVTHIYDFIMDHSRDQQRS